MKQKEPYLKLTPIIHDVIKGENLAYTEFWYNAKGWYYSYIIRFEFVNQN